MPEGFVEEAEESARIDFVQPPFSMADRQMQEFMQWCVDRGIATVTYGSLGAGILTGAQRTLPDWPATDARIKFYDYYKEPKFSKIMELLKTLDKLSEEKQKEQKTVLFFSAIMFIGGFVLSGLGIRFSWYILPRSVSVFFAIVFLAGYLLYAEVMRENTYLSRTVEVQQGQRVIDTGLYGIVRHPMYSVTLLLFLSMPLVLGSLYAFIVFLIYPVLIVKRIKAEEELLERELDGYCEYKKKVKYRLIPFVW